MRYFFHIKDQGELLIDDEGLDMPDTDAAFAEAKHSARDYATQCVRAGMPIAGRTVLVQDNRGNTILEYPVRAVIAEISN